MSSPKKTMPWVPVGHPDFKWVAAKDTDIRVTWRKHGWVPPTELKAKHESRS